MARNKLSRFFQAPVLGNPLVPTESVKNLGVWFDSDFSLSKHVGSICRNSFVQIKEFRRVRRYLTADVSVLVANALISRYLDFHNSLFRSLFKLNMHNLL